MRAEFLSHVGAVRKNNEDAVFCDSKAGLFAVADGIGGRQGGEIASATAVKIVAEKTASLPTAEPKELLREAFYEANNILHQAGKSAELSGMGTTMTAAYISGDNIYLVHVGDSRAYLFNRQGICQLTSDHTLVAELLKDGSITAEAAETHPQRHVITRSLGLETLVEVDELEYQWQSGDYLLLCTDGLHNLVEADEIKEITARAANLRSAIEFMAETAYNRGGYDNISLVLIAHE